MSGTNSGSQQVRAQAEQLGDTFKCASGVDDDGAVGRVVHPLGDVGHQQRGSIDAAQVGDVQSRGAQFGAKVRQQPAQLGDGMIGPAEGEFGRDPQFDSAQAELGQPFGLGLHKRRRRDVGQRTAVPQGEGLGQPAAARLGSPAPNACLPSRTMASNRSASVSCAVTLSW